MIKIEQKYNLEEVMNFIKISNIIRNCIKEELTEFELTYTCIGLYEIWKLFDEKNNLREDEKNNIMIFLKNYSWIVEKIILAVKEDVKNSEKYC